MFCLTLCVSSTSFYSFAALKSGDVLENNRLAFSVAEEELGIPALLDPEDMVSDRMARRICYPCSVFFMKRSKLNATATFFTPT